jgi:hypothetical protein
VKLRAAGSQGTRETVASSPDNAGTGQHRQMVWVRQARQEGVRKEPASNAPQATHQLQPDGSGLGCGAHRQGNALPGTPTPVDVAGREATVKACGVTVARPQGHSWAPTLSNGATVNVGTLPTTSRVVGTVGKARRQLRPPEGGGGAVVVGGRESRPQGEGPQRVRGGVAGPGGR